MATDKNLADARETVEMIRAAVERMVANERDSLDWMMQHADRRDGAIRAEIAKIEASVAAFKAVLDVIR